MREPKNNLGYRGGLRNPCRTTLKPWLKPWPVGFYSGIIIPGLLGWCRILPIHSRSAFCGGVRKPKCVFSFGGEHPKPSVVVGQHYPEGPLEPKDVLKDLLDPSKAILRRYQGTLWNSLVWSVWLFYLIVWSVWLAGRLVGWLAGWLVGWLAFPCLFDLSRPRLGVSPRLVLKHHT